MKHPVLRNTKNIIYYILAWLPVMAGHAYLKYDGDILNLNCILTEAIVFNLLYAILGLSVYFITLYNRIEDMNRSSWLLAHMASYLALSAFWIASGQTIYSMICKVDTPMFHLEGIGEYLIAGFIFYIVLVLLFYLAITLDKQQKQRESEEQLRRLAKESELQALKSQINPHFLFNSLNSANYLTLTEPEKASEMLVKLADYLRFSLKKGANEMVVLSEEIDNCDRYLALEQYRFGNKLQQVWNIEDGLTEIKVPVMILQPLYENAVKHGVYESTIPVAITTYIRKKANFISIEVNNSYDPEAVPRKGAGVGIQNVADRLRLVYGTSGLLTTRKSESSFIATVSIPIN